MKEKEILKETQRVLKVIFSRVQLKSPYYEMLRGLQADIDEYQNQSRTAKELRKQGKTIRQIAKKLGYKHPGSISYLLTK